MVKSTDPFEALVATVGKHALGYSLSKFSCSQIAGLMGLVVTTFVPQITVPLLMRKILDDLKSLKDSMEIVRLNPQFMATQYLASALEKLEKECSEEVFL